VELQIIKSNVLQESIMLEETLLNRAYSYKKHGIDIEDSLEIECSLIYLNKKSDLLKFDNPNWFIG
jgi:hypothetical protein